MTKFNSPISCEWLITEQCNMHCFFCSIQARKESNLRQVLYSEEELDRIITNIKESGCIYVALSGGEPLLHPQCMTIIKRLSREHFIVTLTSNGTLIDFCTAQQLYQAGIKWVQMTLLSPSEKVHDSVMGEGSFQLIMSALRNLKSIGIKTTICFTSSCQNAEDEKKLQELIAPYGADFITRPLKTVGRYEINRRGEGVFVQPNKIIESQIGVTDKAHFAIMPNGDIRTCSECKISFGNVLSDDILFLWRKNIGLGKCIKYDEACIAEYSWKKYSFACELLEKGINVH